MKPCATLLLVSTLLSGAAVWPRWAAADPYEERRVEAGLKLFRALLAADVGLGEKTFDGSRLLIVFFYKDDRKRAEAFAKRFAKADTAGVPEPIHGLPLLIELSADPALSAYASRVPAGIFLAESPDAAGLAALIRYGIAHHRIVDSPFEGHVERGVLGGLAVEAQVRPYLNQATLTASNITLKEFFLKVTKVYR